MLRDETYLNYMWLAANRVVDYVGEMSRREFDADPKTKDAVGYGFEVLDWNRKWTTATKFVPELIRMMEPIVPRENGGESARPTTGGWMGSATITFRF